MLTEVKCILISITSFEIKCLNRKSMLLLYIHSILVAESEYMNTKELDVGITPIYENVDFVDK